MAKASHLGSRHSNRNQRARRRPTEESNPLSAFVKTIHTVDIVRLNDDGDGVGLIDDVTVFVRGALPGENVRVEVTEAHRRHLIAQVVEWLGVEGHRSSGVEVLRLSGIEEQRTSRVEEQRSSDEQDEVSGDAVTSNSQDILSLDRVTPLCGVFEACGGCQLQHVSYRGQLLHKRSVVVNALQRIGRFSEFVVQPTIGMDEPWRYRNQIQVPLKWDEESLSLSQGFFAPGSHTVVQTNSCALVPEVVEQTMTLVPKALTEVLGPDAAFVHHLIIRFSVHTGEQMLILGVSRRLRQERELMDALMVGSIVSLAMTVQERSTGPVWGKTVEHLAGKRVLTERLGDVEFLISPRSFFQVNTRQAEVLTKLVQDRAALSGNETILDAYCGTGTFSLTLARFVKQTVGIETVVAAVHDARENARVNRIDNARFEVGEVEQLLPEWVRHGQKFDVAVLDPPRKGCHPDVLRALIDAGIPKIVYVSCNPSTLARDVRLLADEGYQLGEFQPVDMFPQTSHVECVVAAFKSL
ncbi:23S rRNA (uracil(1939)-C(5))-methyltransferase RlmD [Alicyclobacillus ferrooxydans]|uniref:23S rRNA (uracil(1939)-C(5))-methyltransferase RlmD n=1 Tax=Alicyclobacillus ferrooxydans TaxID=471514 RepID=UPI0006D55AFE|nr:23S rRNA (uracil(1939)-C(5))-methyltransferase RlmD [Alicyclobacillus ferrooxydans]